MNTYRECPTPWGRSRYYLRRPRREQQDKREKAERKARDKRERDHQARHANK